MSKTYFVSYTTRTENDIAWAVWVEWVLRVKLNFTTIMQEYDFKPGDNFKQRMDEALKTADVVLGVLTHTYLQSANCTEEWTNADKFIPVRFDDCVPKGLLKSRVYIDLYGLNKDSARGKLIEALNETSRTVIEPNAPFGDKDEPRFPDSSNFTTHSQSTDRIVKTITIEGNERVVIADNITTLNM